MQADSSLTGVPSIPSGLRSPNARLKLGLPWRKLFILDSKLGVATCGAKVCVGGGGGGDSCISLSRSLLLPGISLLMVLPIAGFILGVVGVSGVFPDDFGDVRLAGAEELFVTLCSKEDKPGVFDLERAFRMPSGVISTRDKMLARAGLGDVVFKADD